MSLLEEIKANRKKRQKQKVSVRDIFTNDKISGYKRGLAVLRAFNMLPDNIKAAIRKCINETAVGKTFNTITSELFQTKLRSRIEKDKANPSTDSSPDNSYMGINFVFASRGLQKLFTTKQGTQGSAKTLENAMFIKLSKNKFVVHSDASSEENKKTPDRRLWRIIKTCTCINQFQQLPAVSFAQLTPTAQQYCEDKLTNPNPGELLTNKQYKARSSGIEKCTLRFNQSELEVTTKGSVWAALKKLGFDSSKLIKNNQLWRNEGDQKLRALIEYNQTNKTLDVTKLFNKLGINSTPTIDGAPVFTDS